MLICRTLVVGSFVTSIGVYSNLIPAYPLVFLPYKIFAFPPQIWRLVTAFFITGPRTGIIFDPYFLYQYGSQLELSSSRFTEPGSFLTYIAFNGLVISVSPVSWLCAHCSLRRLFLFQPRISARPVSLAEAVPGIEEDHCCTSHASIIRKILMVHVRCSHGGNVLRKLNGLSISFCGFDSLHTFTCLAYTVAPQTDEADE